MTSILLQLQSFQPMLREFVTTLTPPRLRSLSLAQWKYDPSLSKRDLRLDFLRGLFLCTMIVYHYHRAWLMQFTYEFFGNVSAAEGFVFISGTVVGLVYLPILKKQGFRAMVRKALKRTLHLYLAFIVLQSSFILIDSFILPLKPIGNIANEVPFWQLVLNIVTLRFGPFGFDILLLYILLLFFTPIVLWLIAQGKTRWVVVISLALYVLYQVAPQTFMWQFYGKEVWRFPVMVWQLLFVAGILLGVYRAQLVQFWRHLAPIQPAVWVIILFVMFFVLRQMMDVRLITLSNAAYEFWFDKRMLGIGRLMNFVVLAIAIAWFVTTFWEPLARGPAKILIPLGQASLYVYMVHLILAYLYRSLAAPLPFATTGIYEILTILFIWFLVRRKFLFAYVPH